MTNKIIFPLYIHLLIYAIASFLFAYSLGISMPDDGLRHISFAENQNIMKSWGDVFPHSLFSNYDPWYAWHFALQSLLKIVFYDDIHILINTFSLFALMLLIDKYIRDEINYNFYSLIYIVVFSIVFITSYRYLMVRPDLLSGLFIMTALLLRNKFLPIFIITIIYAPFYYLFFIYTSSIGLVYMIQKKWKLFFGVFTGSLTIGIFFLLQDYQGYVDTVIYILNDQTLRMGLGVGEGKPIFSILSNLNYYILLPVFLGGSSLLIYWKYKYFSINPLGTFLVVTSILWFNQHRYFHLFLPFILVYIMAFIMNSDKKLFMFYIRKYSILIKRNFNHSKKVPLFYLIAIPYSIVAFSFVYNTKSSNKVIEEAIFFKNKSFNNKTVLMNNLHLDIYKALYHNPTIKFIPSCSIGWFDNSDVEIKDIYIRMQKDDGISEEELYQLIKYINADIYIHYLKNTKQELNFQKLEQFGIIADKIYHNRIIFKIKKRN